MKVSVFRWYDDRFLYILGTSLNSSNSNYFLHTQLEDFIAKEDSKSKSESSSSRKSSLGFSISSDIEVNKTEAGEGDEESFDDEPEIIEDEIQEIQISSEEKVSDFYKIGHFRIYLSFEVQNEIF